ncbi:bifunctional non-homologous end joining protein LigD [Actinoplanes lutulentus]|uniref:Bifunctional non-homologous end joining protein LigD n=1 Tax=Actinoplanes lutulentus TaxID=1287878 RepID=A0A327ZDX1_9ACTN|nr:non-homologous end-joining DNA ligase [Actinoplanes lutulentus]MBB2945109.1 bifunctional non-homologous end joining protein LigD [Actinoplanes lutulentus]RAK31905.1 bifunctional non-homologous end joining protein LigD [Actinoplanes lutulentus]
MKSERFLVTIEGRDVELSNLDKLMYPAAGFTKGEVIDYYTRIAPVMLPHLRGRAATRIRFPNGVEDIHFFEKNKPGGTPDWVRLETLPVPGSTKSRETIEFVVVDDLPTLVWLANLAAIELHTPQWRVGAEPDLLVVDLDPGAPAGLKECCAVATLMRDRLGEDGITAYPKTSGKKGMQLCCPISGAQDAEVVSAYARRVAEELAAMVPSSITAKMAKAVRPGKIFIDWSQNAAAKTTVTPYSLRAGAKPTASAPLTWDEVIAMATGESEARQFGAGEVLERAEEHGDLLTDLLTPGPEVPIRTST